MSKPKPTLSDRAEKAAQARNEALAQALRANIAKRRNQLHARRDDGQDMVVSPTDGSSACGGEGTCAKKGS